MQFSLFRKLLVLLLLVILVSLSASLLLRSLMIRDFKAFVEGQMLDKVYQIQAVLEGRYKQSGHWSPRLVQDDLVWAWQSGIEVRLYDQQNRLVLDSSQALQQLSTVMRQRIEASVSQPVKTETTASFHSYPLFLDENEIGRLDVRLPRPVHEDFFISSSNRFLAYSSLGLGLVAMVFSFLFARKITHPLQELTAAAGRLAVGEPGEQVEIRTTDEIGRLATSFNRMSETLAAQERMRRQLVSNAAHELRTPLMVIKGELEGMIDGLLPTSREALQSLHDEATRLATILDGVDELTRAQAAAMHLNLQKMALLPLVQQVVGRFARQAVEQRVSVQFYGDRTTIGMIDPDKFSRIIINLVSNALRAMPDGGTLTFELMKTSHKSLLLMVSDTGYGIAEEQLTHIFERFYKGKNGGLGLGLSIVKELIECHEGTISVQSALGQGTVFSIELPEV